MTLESLCFLSRRTRPWLSILAAGCAFVSLGWSVVHTRLESSSPAADEVLAEPPATLELRFSGPVNDALSSVALVVPSGDTLRIPVRTPGFDDRVLHGELPSLPDGRYRVLWRTVSADGHPVDGTFGFSVASEPVAETAPADVEPPPADRKAEPPIEASIAESGRAPENGPGAGSVLLAGLGLACLLGFAGLLWYCGSIPLLAEPRIGRVVRALGWVALLLVAADLASWLVRAAPAGSGAGGLFAAAVSRTGAVGAARVLLIGLALGALGSRGPAAAGLAIAAVLLGAMSGHAASISPWITVPANAVHLGAASIWLGGLLLLALVPSGSTSDPDSHLVAVVGSVSSAALFAVVLIAASGVIQSATFVGGLGGITGSTYGRGVLAKWAGLGILVGFGALHRLRILPRLAESGDPGGLRRTVRVETIVMLAVLMLATWLARVPPPVGH